MASQRNHAKLVSLHVFINQVFFKEFGFIRTISSKTLCLGVRAEGAGCVLKMRNDREESA